MNTETIKFDQVDLADGDNGRIVSETIVAVSADGESVSFTWPDGTAWSCDQDALEAVLTDQPGACGR